MNINITKNNNNSDDFTMRDDVIQFSQTMLISARNKYRKRNHSRSNHNSSTQLPLSTPKNKDIPNSDNTLFTKTQIDLGIDLKMNQIFTQGKRNSFTTKNNVRYRESGNPIKIPKSQSVQIQKMDKISSLRMHNDTPNTCSQAVFNNKNNVQIRDLFKSFNNSSQSSFKRIQRKHKKDDIKEGGVQSWLNEALIQASPNLHIDKNDESGGLKAYLIDKSSLLKIGLHPQDIIRLYRSFFVYSVGFNNFLKQICNNNKDLKKSVWKAYALLLQYCSSGDFQTMIGQIQRDKQVKLMEMKQQLQNRQLIIEKSDQTNNKKNAKIMKQIRQLQQRTKDLQSEREVIKQDLRQAEQSFNQQISLRLKYEGRINQIHGVYQQLNQKHKILVQDFVKSQKTIQNQKQTISNLKQQLLNANTKIGEHASILTNIEIQKNVLYDTLANLQKTNKQAGMNYLSAKSQSQNYAFVLTEKKRMVEQLQLTVKNMQSTEHALMQTIKNKNFQFQLAMNENAQLHHQSHQDSVTISNMALQMRSLGLKTTEIAAQKAIQTKKLQQKQIMLRQSNNKINHLEQQLGLRELDLAAQTQKRQLLEQQIQKMNIDIKQMKAKHNQLSYLLDDANKDIRLLQDSIQQKKNDQDKYIQQIEKLKNKIQQLKVQIKQKQSAISIMEQNAKGVNEIWQTKYSKISEEHNRLKQKSDKFQKQRNQMIHQIFASKEKYEKIFVEYKNQRFQRNNLDLYYKQSLTVMQQEIEHIKKLNIQISELNQQNQQLKRKYNSLQMIHKHKTQLLQKDLQFWKLQSQNFAQKITEKQQFIHPFIHQDICGRLIRLNQCYLILNQKFKRVQKNLKELQIEKTKLIQESKNKQRKANNESQNYYKNEINKKQNEITFLKQKMEYQSVKINQSNEQINKIAKQKIIISDLLLKTQTQLISKLNSKNKQLKQLNDKYRDILHLNQTQIKQNEKMIERHQLQKRQLIEKIDELTSKIKHNSFFESPRHKDHKRLLKPQQLQKLKTKKVTESVQAVQNEMQSGMNVQPSRWADGEEYQNDQHERLPSRHEQIQKQLTSIKLAEQQKKKQREGFKNKVKGAYLYYLK